MNATLTRLGVALTLLLGSLTTLDRAAADPLPGRDLLKFTQKPMIATPIPDNNGTVTTYMGHDELSTAYGFAQPGAVPQVYQGKFMADDFADNLSSPVVHVKWWGSYKNDFIHPQMPVNKFLISFESDVPQGPNNPYSHPGTPLLNQVVTRGALAPGSGTFTEKVIRGPDPILNESLYEYNAELHLNLDFPEKKDTVYWLKIVAMVDALPNLPLDPYNPQNSPVPVTQWGWHNRDYTLPNPLASPAVLPGEQIVGQVGINTPVWHFQDDSVAGDVRILPTTAGGYLTPFIDQQNMLPQKYVDFADGPGVGNAASPPISAFSKDLAFEIYTVVPEPAGAVLLAMGMIGLALRRKID